MLSATNTGITIEILQPNGVLYDGTRIYYDTRWLTLTHISQMVGNVTKDGRVLSIGG